jgi:UDP-N-acetylmuramate: L-alanyl-gamma-D-glutamyl-meso-diaminopimelate ligase
MGTLAAMLQEAGYLVRGSDENVYPPMSTFLASRNIQIKEGYRAGNLEPPPDLVVVGNVIRRDNPEAVAAVEQSLDYCSMPQALHRFFLNSSQSVVAAGTHGKTTTAALLVWLLTVAGMDPGCLVGGLMVSLGVVLTSWWRGMSMTPPFSTKDPSFSTTNRKYVCSPVLSSTTPISSQTCKRWKTPLLNW